MRNLIRFILGIIFLSLFFSFKTSYALTDYVFFSVNGDTSLTSMVQGDTFSWGANCAVGAMLDWQIWIDTDQDSVLDDPGDKLIFEFYMADGDTSTEGPPSDTNPIPDGWYISQPFEAGIAPSYYIFKVMGLSDSTTAQRGIEVNPLPSPPNKFTGWINVAGHPAPDTILKNIWIEADDSSSESFFWAGLTDDSGHYEINVGNSGTGHTFNIQPSDIYGFVIPSSQRKVASGVVDSVNFYYELPVDSIFGQIKDQNDSLLKIYLYVWCDPKFSGASEKNSQGTSGIYKIFFGSSELGEWDIGMSSEGLIPNYLVPNSFNFDNQAQQSIEHDFICQQTDTVIYGRVTENGGLPAHSYKIYANSGLLQSWTEAVSGTDSNNSFVLHISSLDPSNWFVNIAIWDDRYPIPTGYILEGGGVFNVSPGDTVVFNFISGKMVRDTIEVDQPDPGLDWNNVWVNLFAFGENYGGNPDINGVYTIYADTGSYDLKVYCQGYLSNPATRIIYLSYDTSGGLGFILNQAHTHISGTLSNVSLPLPSVSWVGAGTDTWPKGYQTGVEVDRFSGTFDLYVCDGNWIFYPPYIPGYITPPNQNLIISESPDTLRTLNFSYSPSEIKDDGTSEALPEDFALEQNYPNPFNQSTELGYYIPEKTQSIFVSLRIYNLLGQCLKTLVNEIQTSGRHSAVWDGRDERGKEVASGIYFYRLEAGNFKQTRRMVLLK